MNQIRSNIYYILSGISLITLLAVIFYQKLEIQQKLDKINDQANVFEKYMKLKENIEGKFVWEIGLISENKIKYLDKDYRIIFLYDSIGCLQCYNFHQNYLRKYIGLENITVLCNKNFEFIKKDFSKAEILESNGNFSAHKMLVLLINKDGRILYVDFPEFQLIKNRSKEFYRITSRFFD